MVNEVIFSGNLDREAARCRAQQRRCLHHGQRIASICGSLLGERSKEKQRTLNADTIKLIKKYGQYDAEDEKHVLEAIEDANAVDGHHYYAIVLNQANKYESKYKNNLTRLAQEKKINSRSN